MNTNGEKVHFGMVFDENVIEIGLVAAISLFRTSVARIIHLHVVCDALQNHIKARLEDVLGLEKGVHSFELHHINTNELCSDLPEASHLTRAAYVRLFFPELFPELQRIMYLDTDILAIQDITEDAMMDFSEGIAAALDAGGNNLNSGVMILDLEKIRKSGLFQQALDWIRNNKDVIRLCDQDGIRAVVGKQYHRLPQSLNSMRINPVQKPKILHYAGKGLKPHTWKASARNDRNGISAYPWVDFRETTVMSQGKVYVYLLKTSQFISTVFRVLIFRPQRNISRSIRKRLGFVRNKVTKG